MLGDIIKGVTMVTGSEVVGVEITGTVDDSLLVTATGESNWGCWYSTTLFSP